MYTGGRDIWVLAATGEEEGWELNLGGKFKS